LRSSLTYSPAISFQAASHAGGSASRLRSAGDPDANRDVAIALALRGDQDEESNRRRMRGFRAERVAGWWPCGYSSREETGAGPTWRPTTPRGAQVGRGPGQLLAFASASPTDDFSSIRWSWFT
jgi:hypothetical protein